MNSLKDQDAPSHQLLGSRADRGNGEEMWWKSSLKLDNNPWLNEHILLGGKTFPVAGYVAMAGECMHQISVSNLELVSLKDITIESALFLGLDDKIELHTKLKRLSLEGGHSQWYEIRITSFNEGQWLALFSGMVACEGGLDPEKHMMPTEDESNLKSINQDYWYDMIASRGLEYGASYRGLSEISASLKEHKANATIHPFHHTGEWILHPVNIDHCLQVVLVAMCKGQGRLLTDLSVTTSIKYLILRTGGWKQIRVRGMTVQNHYGELTYNLSAVNEDGLPILSIDHGIANLITTRDLKSEGRLFSFIKWDTDITYQDPNRRLAPFQRDLDPTIVLERLALLGVLPLEDPPGKEEQKIAKKLQNNIGARKTGSFGLISDISSFAACEPSSRKDLMQLLRKQITGTELSALGHALEQCLTSGAPFSGTDTERMLLLEQMNPFVRNNGIISETIRLFAHKNPRLRVLEFGNGTNENTHLVLKALRSQFGERLYLTYVYASASPIVEKKAKEKFENDDNVEFVVFDAKKGVEEQGMKAGRYDLIITTDFISPEHGARARAKYLKDLLHPNGRVVLLETVPEPEWVSLLKNYLSQETRSFQNESVKRRSIEDVHTALVDNNFIFSDDDTPSLSNPKIIAKLRPSDKVSSWQVTFIVPKYHLPLVRAVEKTFASHNVTCIKRALDDDIPPGQDIIVFVDFDEPYLYNITEPGLKEFVKLVASMKGSMIWVTPNAQISCQNPNSAMILGMLRTIRSEFRKDITVVEVDSKRSTNDASSKSLLQIYQRLSQRTKSKDLDPDYELAIVDGDIKIPRLQWTTAEDSKPVCFRSNACYFLVGGLGGLGKMISTWMVENGARNIMFFSRSAKEEPETTPFFEHLRSQDCEVSLFAGDVTSLADVEGAVKKATKPIAGVMQMSAVMRDNLMSKMTFAEWNASVQPKVQGTWNLHHATTSITLDFFLLFSSICGITGQWGQGNYNAANSFLDAFVNYRHGQNLAASVADIGFMGDIGMAVKSDALVKTLKGSGYYYLNERHLIDVLTIAIENSLPEGDPFLHKSQVGLGIRSTKPFSSPSNRVAWKKDARMAISHHFGNVGEIGDSERKILLKHPYNVLKESN